MPEATTAEEVARRFCVSPRASQSLADWQADRPEVAAHVLAHVTRTPYSLTSAVLHDVARATEHALGEVQKSDADAVPSIRDWTSPFAFTHVFHYALETLAAPYTYQRFRQFCRDDARAQAMLWRPAQEAVESAAQRVDQEVARNAMRWRVGLAYYSFMRELVTVVALRERGLDLQVHPLADALFRVDAWSGSTVVALYIGNAAFRDGTAGRKPTPEGLLGDSFQYVSIRLRTQHAFGVLHLPSEGALDQAAREIRTAQDG